MTNVRIITDALGGSALSQRLQRGEAPARWTGTPPSSAVQWRERALQRAGERRWEEHWAALEPAIAATGQAAERLDRVRRAGGVVVTTGQQPGLFGGPVYTWSKAMSALAMADAIERETGVATAAVFWAATDDADFAEASFTVLARTGSVEVLRCENAPLPGTPMSSAPIGNVQPLRARLVDAAGSAADPRPLHAVRNAYDDPDRSIGDAYVALLRTLLAPLGMPVLDASHAAVRQASDATLRAALERAESIERALVDRTAEIRSEGLEPQVADVAGLSLAFVREGTVKRRLSTEKASSAAEDADAWLTPNVLLRPIVEHAILPTVAYLGGPGELAYFAQVSAVADTLGVGRPLALPRWSCTLVEPAVARLLARFGVEPDALAHAGTLEGAIARAAMSGRATEGLQSVRRAIAALPESLASEAESLGLEGAVQGSMQSLQHRVDRLERRLLAGIKRREHVRLRDVATLRAALYPLGTRQERMLNLIPFLSRHGLDLLTEMRAAALVHARGLVGVSPGS